MFWGRWNTSLHQLGYMIGKDVSVGYTVGWGCVSWLHYSCRQHSDPIAQHGDLVTAEEVSVVYIIGWGCVSWLQRCWGCVSRLYSKMRLCQLVTGYTMGWGCGSWLHCGMRLCQLVTQWDEVVSVGYSVMRLSVGYMMIAGSGSEGAAQWPYSTTKRSSGDCRRSAQLHHTAWHQHCMLVWRTPPPPPLPQSLILHPFSHSPFPIYLPLPPPPWYPPPLPPFLVSVSLFLITPISLSPPPPPPFFFCVGLSFIAHPSPISLLVSPFITDPTHHWHFSISLHPQITTYGWYVTGEL